MSESESDNIYVLMDDATPKVAHTRMQGAAMEMVTYSPAEQKSMWVAPIRLVRDE